MSGERETADVRSETGHPPAPPSKGDFRGIDAKVIGAIIEELVQTAAAAEAMIESLDRNQLSE